MLNSLKQATWIRYLFAFNQHERDRWVATQAATIRAGAIVLDVGAGSCPYRQLFAHCEYRTHDFSQLPPHQILGKKGYGQIDYVGDILSIPITDHSVDVILCTEVLEHIPEPIQAVKEFARILKAGGVLLLTAPLGSGLHQEPYHFYGGYTPHWYRKFLSEAGFDIVKIQPNGGFFMHYAQEGLRFITRLAPWREPRNLCWAPIWLVGLLWCLVLMPLTSRSLDRLDQTKDFTVGYFVVARRHL